MEMERRRRQRDGSVNVRLTSCWVRLNRRSVRGTDRGLVGTRYGKIGTQETEFKSRERQTDSRVALKEGISCRSGKPRNPVGLDNAFDYPSATPPHTQGFLPRGGRYRPSGAGDDGRGREGGMTAGDLGNEK